MSHFKKITFSFCQSYIFYGRNESEHYSIKIDLFWQLEIAGFRYVGFEDLFENCVQYELFCGVDPVRYNIHALLRGIVANGKVNERYFSRTKELLRSNAPMVKNEISKIARGAVRDDLLSLLNGELSNLDIFESKNVRDRLRLSLFSLQPVGYLIRTLARYFYRIKQYVFDEGADFISFHGPDGSGKTTAIENVVELIRRILLIEENAIQYEHFRPHLVPNSRALIAGKSYDESREDYSKPHRGVQKSQWLSLLAMVYYLFDYILGYLLKYKRKMLYHNFIVFDRYIFDFLLDEKRMSIRLPFWIKRVVIYFCPKPDISFYLLAKGSEVHRRKNELSIHEINRQNEFFKIGLKDKYKFVEVDANQCPDKVADDIMTKYISTCFKKI